MATEATTLPRWDMSTIYPGLDSLEFRAAFGRLTHDITTLAELFDREGVGERPLADLDATVATFEQVVERYNAVLDEVHTMRAYITAFVTTDSRDEVAQARLSELQRAQVPLTQLGTRFTAWIGGLDVDVLVTRTTVAREHAYGLRKAHELAHHLMSPAEEALAAGLDLTGASAWSKLCDSLTSQLVEPVQLPDGMRTLPMSAIWNLSLDPDREVRRRAHKARLAGYARISLPLAAALNGIKGQVDALTRRRGWQTPLDAALFDANIDRQTLDAMLGAIHEWLADFRRYFRAKAHVLGVPVLAGYDLHAPVGTGGHTWTFDEAARFIVEQFGTYSPRLGEFAARAFRERWIDAEPREGKRDGASCMWLRGDESRVLANFTPSFYSVSMLAHELGHAYHNLNLAGCTMLQRELPMTLAETASTFCETLIRNAALKRGDPSEQLEILAGALQNVWVNVVWTTAAFQFEQAVFERRQERELSVDEFNELMLQAQRDIYGDAVDSETLPPYMWATLGHFYRPERSFYNFPYMFGQLFGLGLYTRYERDPEGFHADYDKLLSSTGLADATTLAARFGIDIRTADFWRSSLDIVRADINRFEQIIGVTRP